MNDMDKFIGSIASSAEAFFASRRRRYEQLIQEQNGIDFDRNSLSPLAYHYYLEAQGMFVDGYFTGVVLLCAAIAEMMLLDQLTKMGKSSGLGKQPGLKSLVGRAKQQVVLDDAEAQLIYDLNDLRVDIIHSKVSELEKRGENSLKEKLFGKSPENYFTPISGAGIEQDAHRHLHVVGQLVIKFYPPEKLH